jgi:hypothetical protein
VSSGEYGQLPHTESSSLIAIDTLPYVAGPGGRRNGSGDAHSIVFPAAGSMVGNFAVTGAVQSMGDQAVPRTGPLGEEVDIAAALIGFAGPRQDRGSTHPPGESLRRRDGSPE